MRNGRNTWLCLCGYKEKHPSGINTIPLCSECCEMMFASFPEHRVKGYKYTPYQGYTFWEKCANHGMAQLAQKNFKYK